MNSTQIYKVVREAIAPWCKQNGFKRTPGGMLGWFKPQGDNFIVFWFQCNQDGWDAYAGSSFCVEFQFSDSHDIGGGASELRHRLSYFLTLGEREEVRQKQNHVIAKLDYPPKDHFTFQMDANVANWYRQKFIAVEMVYPDKYDIWLRYKDGEDVKTWAEFVLRRLPKVLAQLSGPSV